MLNPFAGTATTGLAALWHGRRFLGIELNLQYAEIGRERLWSRAEIERVA